MADLTDTIISTSAMLGACLATVRAALAQTRTVLRDGAPKGPVDGRLSRRPDTLDVFCGKGRGAATFGKVTAGSYFVADDSGIEPTTDLPYGTANCSDTVTVALPIFGALKSATVANLPPLSAALSRRRDLLGPHDGGHDNG